MKCAKCGAELKLGCIYCSVCGQEAQIVSDSNLLEEELLRDLLKGEEPAKEEKSAKRQPVEGQKPQKNLGNKKAFIGAMICLSVVVLIGIILAIVIVNKNKNSYEYQLKKAQNNVEAQNYVKALEYYERALELKDKDIEARLEMAEVYVAMDEERSAIRVLLEVIGIDAFHKEAYQRLIELYAGSNDYDAILALKEKVEDDEILSLFEEYEVKPPKFSIEPGTYGEYITIEVTAEDGQRIYYTTDGTDPIEDGRLYRKPFSVKEQTTLELQIVSCNEYGIYSNVVIGNFTVKLKKPDKPVATPDRGSFTEPTTIQLAGPEGCKIYYTWDGTDPTVQSELYTEPIAVPEGDNILSVILVDKYDMISDVLKCNYKYFP